MEPLSPLLPFTMTFFHFASTCATLALLYFASVIVYRLHFHPLAKFAGPLLGRCTTYYTWRGIIRRDRCVESYRLLQKYGNPFPIAPNELIFADRKSHNDIYGQCSNPCLKDDDTYARLSAMGSRSILIESGRYRHARLRRVVAHGFSNRALLEYESVIAWRVGKLVDDVLQPLSGGGTFNIFPVPGQH